MKVQFVALQGNGKETREKPLFTEEWATVYKGKMLRADGRKFQIHSLQWINKEQGHIKAICKEFVHPYSKQTI